MKKRRFSNTELVMPVLYGMSFMYAIGVLCRWLGAPVGFDLIGIAGALVGAVVFIYRFFAKTTAPRSD